MSGSHLSRDFFELIKNIGECKSKQEEDKILTNEVATLKANFTGALSPKKMKEALVRMMYAEMLGHDASFGHIHAVNMTQQTNLVSKRVGYLAAAVCLHAGHELTTLMVNTMRRDLTSTNHVEVCASLIAIPKLINAETMPALFQSVVQVLEHPQEVVRKKAVMVLHRFYQVQPSSIAGLPEKLRRVLCDKDPAVMGASLCILHDMAEADPAGHKDLVPSFVSILKQITEHRLPSSFDYHRMPAPWIQIKLLKLLAVLGASDKRASEGMYEVLYDVLRRADTGINIGYAVIYDCVRTITTIYPNIQLLETAANHISRFVASENHNLKYLGIKSLASIVQVDQKYALDHQMVVVECLEDTDETLKRKTLDLLFRMTNATNVVFVVDKLIFHLRSATDVQFRASLTERLTQLAERYAPDNSWYIQTMNAVFELGGELVRPDVAHNLMRLIAEGSGEDDDADMALRKYAAQTYFGLLEKSKLPDVLMQVVCWVLGEYGYLCEQTSLPVILERLSDTIERQFSNPSTRCWVLVAMCKLVAQMGEMPEEAAAVCSKYANSSDVALAKYALEFEALAENMEAMRFALPVDASCEDLEADPALGFLDAYVAEAIANGAQPYLAKGQRPDELDVAGIISVKHAGPALNFAEYKKQEAPRSAPLYGAPPSSETSITSAPAAETLGGLNMAGVANKWGATGFNSGGASSAPAPAAPLGGFSTGTPATSFGGSTGSSGAVSSAAPAAPRELSEKEKMAAALFGGIAAKPSTHAPPAPAPVFAPAPAPPPTVAPAAIGPAAPAEGPPKEKKKKKKPDGGPAAAGGGGGGGKAEIDLLGDLLGDLSAPSAPSPPVTAPQQPATGASPPPGVALGGDLMGLFDGPISTPSAPPLPSLPLMSGGVPPSIAASAVIPATQLPADAREVVADASIRVLAATSIHPDRTEVKLFLQAQTPMGLRNVAIQLEPPSCLRTTVTASPPAEARGARVTIHSLHSTMSCMTASSVCIQPLTSEIAILGQLSYSDPQATEPRLLSFKLPLTPFDLIRPQVMTTPQFGQLWPANQAEWKGQAYSVCGDKPQAFMQLMSGTFHLHPVEVIGMECIACGKLVGSDIAVLVHGKLGLMAGRALELTVRTREKRFTEVLQRQIVDAVGAFGR